MILERYIQHTSKGDSKEEKLIKKKNQRVPSATKGRSRSQNKHISSSANNETAKITSGYTIKSSNRKNSDSGLNSKYSNGNGSSHKNYVNVYAEFHFI